MQGTTRLSSTRMYASKLNTVTLAAAAVLSFAIGGLALHSWATFDGLPSLSELRKATGHVVSVGRDEHGIRFALEEAPKKFYYASKSGELELVKNALTGQDSSTVTVYYNPSDPVRKLGSQSVFFQVLQVSAGEKLVRSRDEVEAAWQSDEQVALWLSIAFALGGAYFARTAWTYEKLSNRYST